MFNWGLGFLDSYWFATHKDKIDPLGDPEWIKWFTFKLTGREFTGDAQMLSAELVIFRAALMEIVHDLQRGIFLEAEAIALLNHYLKSSRGHHFIQVNDLSKPTYEFEPDQVDCQFVLANLAEKWYKLLFETDRTRIRVCENPDCACFYFDESKNKSKRHCASNCSNVMKVRRFRSKHKSEL